MSLSSNERGVRVGETESVSSSRKCAGRAVLLTQPGERVFIVTQSGSTCKAISARPEAIRTRRGCVLPLAVNVDAEERPQGRRFVLQEGVARHRQQNVVKSEDRKEEEGGGREGTAEGGGEQLKVQTEREGLDGRYMTQRCKQRDRQAQATSEGEFSRTQQTSPHDSAPASSPT